MSAAPAPIDVLLSAAYARIASKPEWESDELFVEALAEAAHRGIDLDDEDRARLGRRARAVLWGLTGHGESRYTAIAWRVLGPLMEQEGLNLGEAHARLRRENPFAAQAVDLLFRAAQLDAERHADDLGCDPGEVDAFHERLGGRKLDSLSGAEAAALCFPGHDGTPVSVARASKKDLALLAERTRKRGEWFARAAEAAE